jgi:U3 small nucleolar RNA-associated protein 21
MDSPITSLSLAPAMDVLVTTHVEKRGLYTWTNELIFGSVENIITSSKPIRATIPDMSMERIAKGLAGDQEKKKSGANPAMLVHSTQRANDALDALESESSSGEDDSSISMHADDAGGSSEEESDDDVQDEEKRVEILKRDQEVLSGQEPVAPEMITLSMLPRSQWLNLVHIDSIKTRNKPIEPPKKPEAAPFFLPTVSSANAGRDPVFAVDESDERLAREAEAAWGGNASDESGDDADDEKTLGETTRIHKAGAEDAVNQRESGLIPLLTSYKKDKKWTPVVQYLKSLSPSNLDIQLRSLALANIDGTIDHDVLITFLALLADAISSDTNFEFLQALLRAFILIHGEIISEHEDMKHVAATVQQQTTKAWNRICHTLQHTQCIVGLLGSMQT